MNNEVEKQVRRFYDEEGWVADESNTVAETTLFRDVGGGREIYDEKLKASLLKLLEKHDGRLMIVGSGDLPQSHVQAAQQFNKVVCIDISQRALDIGKQKLGDKGTYHLASILEAPLVDNSVDAVLCAHVLYHIDRYNQQRAVEEMIRITKTGGRIVIIYLNPNAPLMLIQRALKLFRVNKLLGKAKLYVHSYPINWWSQFESDCKVSVSGYDAISTNQARTLLPNKSMRSKFFNWASRFEDNHPRLAARLWSYVIVVLDKSHP
ncbi:MAG: class I SAM-dependent methyltransferase [Gammaproteobacteria bacterium]|nr:class I SAM-dependent methyltransferase [Gammaproteobacteria bacterium]